MKQKSFAKIEQIIIAIAWSIASILLSNGMVLAIYPVIGMLSLGSFATILVSITNIAKNVVKDVKIPKDKSYLTVGILLKMIIGITIYQLYLMGFVFIAGMFTMILIINLFDNLFKFLE